MDITVPVSALRDVVRRFEGVSQDSQDKWLWCRASEEGVWWGRTNLEAYAFIHTDQGAVEQPGEVTLLYDEVCSVLGEIDGQPKGSLSLSDDPSEDQPVDCQYEPGGFIQSDGESWPLTDRSGMYPTEVRPEDCQQQSPFDTVDGETLEMFQRLFPFVADKPFGPYGDVLKSYHIRTDGQLEACDGHRAIRWPISQFDHPEWGDVLLHRLATQALLSMGRAESRLDVSIWTKDGSSWLGWETSPNGYVVTRNPEGDFPDLERVMPSSKQADILQWNVSMSRFRAVVDHMGDHADVRWVRFEANGDGLTAVTRNEEDDRVSQSLVSEIQGPMYNTAYQLDYLKDLADQPGFTEIQAEVYGDIDQGRATAGPTVMTLTKSDTEDARTAGLIMMPYLT